MPGGLVEHAIDVLVAVGGAEFLGQGHRLIDHHLVGHVKALAQLEGAHAQQGVLDGVQFLQLAIQQRLEGGIELVDTGGHPVQQGLEVFQVHVAEIVIGAELCLDIGQGRAGHVPLVEGLHAVVPGLATGSPSPGQT